MTRKNLGIQQPVRGSSNESALLPMGTVPGPVGRAKKGRYPCVKRKKRVIWSGVSKGKLYP